VRLETVAIEECGVMKMKLSGAFVAEVTTLMKNEMKKVDWRCRLQYSIFLCRSQNCPTMVPGASRTGLNTSHRYLALPTSSLPDDPLRLKRNFLYSLAAKRPRRKKQCANLHFQGSHIPPHSPTG
jgi:hypothetical protein